MRFTRLDDLLIFDEGRMTVKTEVESTDEDAIDPGNQKFSHQLTTRYDELANNYEVLTDLYEYAKLVALAKYLKESGVPLHWFLMANKDLVITEDSPGTVKELAKGSEFFDGITITGGVDITQNTNYVYEANYKYDDKAIEEIKKVLEGLYPPSFFPGESEYKTVSKPKNQSIKIVDEKYSVVPQSSLTSGKDRRGIRYQTDFAMNANGYQINEQSLNKIYYRLVDRETNRLIFNHIKKHDLKLTKKDDKYIRLYKESKIKASKDIDNTFKLLKLIEGIDYRNKDDFAKDVTSLIGKETFDRISRLLLEYSYYSTNLELVRYFNPNKKTNDQFGQGWQIMIPYRIEVPDDNRIRFRNLNIPKEVILVNMITDDEELLEFDTEKYTSVGYLPKDNKSDVVGAFLVNDLSYRLQDKMSNSYYFNSSGFLTDMKFSEHHHYKIEYIRDGTSNFNYSPYIADAVDDKKIEVGGYLIPLKIKVTNLTNNKFELFEFKDNYNAIVYKPVDMESSEYEMMYLMANTSFKLVHKTGNKSSLKPDGLFNDIEIFSDTPIVKSISQGGHKIEFKYTVGLNGKVMIAEALLYTQGNNRSPSFVIMYDYDSEDRICSVSRNNIYNNNDDKVSFLTND